MKTVERIVQQIRERINNLAHDRRTKDYNGRQIVDAKLTELNRLLLWIESKP